VGHKIRKDYGELPKLLSKGKNQGDKKE